MTISRDFMRVSKTLLGPGMALFMLGYFSYHMFEGNHGIRTWWVIKRQLATAQTKFAELERTRTSFEHRVKLLHPSSLCPDLLEEQSRKQLGYAHKNEIIVVHK